MAHLNSPVVSCNVSHNAGNTAHCTDEHGAGWPQELPEIAVCEGAAACFSEFQAVAEGHALREQDGNTGNPLLQFMQLQAEQQCDLMKHAYRSA